MVKWSQKNNDADCDNQVVYGDIRCCGGYKWGLQTIFSAFLSGHVNRKQTQAKKKKKSQNRNWQRELS